MNHQGIAAALTLAFLAFNLSVLPVTTAEAECMTRGSGGSSYGENCIFPSGGGSGSENRGAHIEPREAVLLHFPGAPFANRNM